MAQFPAGVQFFKVGEIDQCALCEARGYGERNPQERDRFYVAACYEDLATLAESGRS